MDSDINFGLYKENAKSKNQSIFWNFIFQPFRSGVFGFISFFLVLITAKYLGYLIGSHDSFQIDSDDFLLSILGFILVFLIKFLENFKEKSI
ncbi:MAG: hypothetical protein M1480_15200 [Bacteroidetes bacterium]|nr:hypothetical protein [Bacteroidota bacterium]